VAPSPWRYGPPRSIAAREAGTSAPFDTISNTSSYDHNTDQSERIPLTERPPMRVDGRTERHIDHRRIWWKCSKTLESRSDQASTPNAHHATVIMPKQRTAPQVIRSNHRVSPGYIGLFFYPWVHGHCIYRQNPTRRQGLNGSRPKDMLRRGFRTIWKQQLRFAGLAPFSFARQEHPLPSPSREHLEHDPAYQLRTFFSSW